MAGDMRTRKLVAVMFTDIEGYTSMFHNNESRSLDMIAQHRKNLAAISSKYSGQIDQFYGDGSLVIFESVIDAVKSAVEIQHASREQELPVRIGIHLGDIVIKEGSLFGDVINLASRLQAIGVPGSIIVTRKIVDELANHPEISSIYLGRYELKNIAEPQDLYAISGPGLFIPEKKIPVVKKKYAQWQIILLLIVILAGAWYLFKNITKGNLESNVRDEKIAVPPFQNFTADENFNLVSQMAAHWITNELIELANANVVNYPSGTIQSNTAEASMPVQTTYFKKTDAVNIIRGAFSFTGKSKDSLVFWANIFNTLTQEPLPIEFAKAYCDADNPLICIQHLSNEIKGFWKSKSEQVLSPPNYEAYKLYLKARNSWDGINDSIPESYLRESIRQDPKFLDAYFLLLDLFYNQQNPQEATDTLRSIRRRFTELTPRQENYLLFHEEDIKGRRVEAFRHFMKEYAVNPKDLFTNTTGMVMAQTYLNDPELVLKFHDEIDIDRLDLRTCTYCLERVMLALQAYTITGQRERASEMAEKVKLYALKRDDYHRLVEWYITTGDTVHANQILARTANMDLDQDPRYLVFIAGRQAMLKGDTSLRNYYADKAIHLYSGKPSRGLARAYYLRDDLDNAEMIYNSLLKEEPGNKRIIAELGLIYAKRGNKSAAEKTIQQLDMLKQAYDYGEIPYMQGRIKAVIGETKEAIRYLNQALDEGYLFFNSVSFDGDPDLLVLKDNKDYQALLVRNRQFHK